jgi:sensor histidine kinase regulating citrate/malate metabolism
MRLITKINCYFGIILIVLMVAVFVFTRFFIQNELLNQTKRSLQVTYESFKLTLQNINIGTEQEARAVMQTKGDIIGISTRDRLCSVLNYYLNLTASEYDLDLVEVLDKNGVLLADNQRAYENDSRRTGINKGFSKPKRFYLSQRGADIYLINTFPVTFSSQPVGYLNLGTILDQNLVTYFASVLHGEMLFLVGNRYVVGNSNRVSVPAQAIDFLRKHPSGNVFIPGEQIGVTDYDYIFCTIPSNGATAIVGIANNRAGIKAALLRLQLFLWLLTGFGFIFGFMGANLLARNIKKSIFGMEPQEIASLLDQRTTILQSTFEGVIALDHEGMITLVNIQAEQILPTNLALLGQPAEKFFSALNIKEVFKTGQAIYNQQQVIGEIVIVYNCVPIKTQNRVLGAVITLRDLTEFQKVAEELVEVKNYTQALRAQSHEFINKLQSISGLIQLGKYETALMLLHETSGLHQDLISFLHNAFSTSAISGILLGKFNRARELNIDFAIDKSSRLPKGATIPDTELVCIIGNLIENAFEALQESSQTPKKVSINIGPAKNYLRILVADNGPGISPRIKQQIFTRGFTTKKGQNKGLGLSLVKQSVDNLHGLIRVHSGKTTLFMVKIPLKNGGTGFVDS